MNISWQEVVESIQSTRDKQMEYWFTETLFSFSWWTLLIVTLGVLLIWIKVVDNKRIFEIITYGTMVEIIALTLDSMGVFMMWWNYKHTLTPLPSTVEIHIVIMPLIYMMIYQYFSTWRSFIIAVTINAAIFAFILEPILVWLDVYENKSWKHIYSFLPYILIAVLCKAVMNKLKSNAA